MNDITDVIVVGAGIGGLTAACYLARAGLRVCLLEAQNEPGGLCRTIRRDGLEWNLSLYSLRGCRPGGLFPLILDELGLAGRITFRHLSSAYRVIINGRSLPLSTDSEEMLSAAESIESGGARKLAALLEHIRKFDPVRSYPELARATFREAAGGSGLSGPLLAAFAAPLMISLGLPPERASAYFAFMKYQLILQGGLSYPEGGPDHLVRTLVETAEDAGAQICLREKVVGLSVGPGGIKRVETAGGPLRQCRFLVLNANAGWAMHLLSPFLPDAYRKKTSLLVPALSARILFLAAPRSSLEAAQLDRFPHVIHLGNDNLGGIHKRLRQGDDRAASEVIGLTSPAIWDGGPPEREEQPVTGFFLAPPAGGDGALGPALDNLESTVRRLLPGPLSLKGACGPADLLRLTANRGGSFCGWEMGPERYGPGRLPQRVPIPGVFLAGHWTEPGPSILNVALSGRKAAGEILRRGLPIR